MNQLKPLTALVVLAFALTACNLVTDGPDESGLNVGTVYMLGVLEQQVEINASGSWQLTTGDDWLSASRTSGFGDTLIDLQVDPAGLSPGEYTTQLRLDLEGEDTQHKTVVFAFPKLSGSVVIGSSPTQAPSSLSVHLLPDRPGRLLVGLPHSGSTGISRAKADSFHAVAEEVLASKPGVVLQRSLPSLGVAVVRAENMRKAAAALAVDPNVRYVEQDAVLHRLALDEYRSLQWAHDILRVDQAWTIENGTGVQVAIIDAGFDEGHPDFGDNVSATYDFVSDTVELTPRPNCGTHGEHVAGIVAAESNLQGVAGIAADSGMILLNVGSGDTSSPDCPLHTSDVAAALDWVAGGLDGPRAEIVNMSLGGPSSATLEGAVERAYRAGVTLLAASGNSASGTVLFPAAYPEVIAVSATGRSDEIASYSTVGPEVFVSAPGGNGSDSILSTGHTYNGDTPEYGYLYMQGTSMASPAAAAVAALAKSVDPSLTPIGIAGLLADSSVDLGEQGRDEFYGYGRVDAYSAVTRASENAGSPSGYLLKGDGKEWSVPVVEQFVVDHYVGGTLFLEIGTDDDWDGVINETGEYYGAWSGEVQFSGEYFDVELSVDQQ